LLWRDIAAYWPQARYLFLLRHPAGILASAVQSRPDGHTTEPATLVTTYLRELRAAMAALGLAGRERGRYADGRLAAEALPVEAALPR
jgi:hypothetical protein